MKVRAPKAKLLSRTGDLEADLMIHAYKAGKRLQKLKKRTEWKAACAAATDRRLLIGRCALFNPPR